MQASRTPATIFLLSGTLLLLILSFLSEGSYGGEDSFMHYLFARYAPAHPLLFLDHWGKPLFTMLSSPFAAFGFQGIKVFNILCVSATAWIGFEIANSQQWKHAYLAIPLILFNPLFFVTGMSGLTEPLFALILCGGVLLWIQQKYLSACLLISFLPFARSEGNLMIAFFFGMTLLEKKWKPLPFLLTGTLVFSLIGGVLKNDFLWLRTENPYQGAEEIYGRGEWLHFIRANKEIFGVPQSILVLIGGIGLMFRIFTQKNWENFKMFAMIAGPFLVYFFAHTIFWKFGLFGSFGLIRVMAAVVPLASLVAVFGFQFVTQFIPTNYRFINYFILYIPLAFVIYDPFFQYRLPYPLDERQTLMKGVAQWLPKEKIDRVYAAHPYFFHAAQIDIFDSQKRRPLEACMHESLSSSDLIVWDNQFGPNECGMKSGWQDSLPIHRIARLEEGGSVVELYRRKPYE